VLRVHFVESLFHLNDVVTHAKYNRFPQSEAERAKFSLAGDGNRNKRAYIYRMLLEPMTDLDKLQITQVRYGGRNFLPTIGRPVILPACGLYAAFRRSSVAS
jgi:hypothetical protein